MSPIPGTLDLIVYCFETSITGEELRAFPYVLTKTPDTVTAEELVERVRKTASDVPSFTEATWKSGSSKVEVSANTLVADILEYARYVNDYAKVYLYFSRIEPQTTPIAPQTTTYPPQTTTTSFWEANWIYLITGGVVLLTLIMIFMLRR